MSIRLSSSRTRPKSLYAKAAQCETVRTSHLKEPPVSYVPRQDRPADKAVRYAELLDEITAVLEGEPNVTARMATVASMLNDAMPDFFWTGFYVVDGPDELVVGPYQGTLGCLRIKVGRGVCGTAAAERRTVIVEDVHAFPGHIACDSRSQSEIVLPVFGPDGALIAVFDVDAEIPAAFDQQDADGLEAILARVFAGA
jgi:L-methionine (R)-S-oxide reductase